MRSPLVVDDRTTRGQIQHEIARIRADDPDASVDALLDALLAAEPEAV